MKTIRSILSLLVFLCLVSACSAPVAQVATATATAVLPTALPQPSATLAPSATPLPTQWADTQIGDRVKVNTIAIQGRQIVMEMLVPGPNDPLCCPSLAETQTYRLTKGGLFLTGLTSQTPTGEVRTITIHSPLDYSNAGASVEVSGDFSIAPFENTFTYTIQDDSHHPLDQGSFQVKPDTQAGPGTFAATIDLSKSSPGMIIHLNIQDVSAADGSILALVSIELMRNKGKKDPGRG